MKICRFDDDRLGLVEGSEVLDVSEALTAIPPPKWPYRHGDALIAHLPAVLERAKALAAGAGRRPLSAVRLRPPVANPSKIVNAPINYQAHIDEAKRDQGIAHGREIKTIADWGLFLKSPSSLVGAGDGVKLRFRERRNDLEPVPAERAAVAAPAPAGGPRSAGRERDPDHVGGEVVRTLGTTVVPGRDTVRVDGRAVQPQRAAKEAKSCSA